MSGSPKRSQAELDAELRAQQERERRQREEEERRRREAAELQLLQQARGRVLIDAERCARDIAKYGTATYAAHGAAEFRSLAAQASGLVHELTSTQDYSRALEIVVELPRLLNEAGAVAARARAAAKAARALPAPAPGRVAAPVVVADPRLSGLADALAQLDRHASAAADSVGLNLVDRAAREVEVAWQARDADGLSNAIDECERRLIQHEAAVHETIVEAASLRTAVLARLTTAEAALATARESEVMKRFCSQELEVIDATVSAAQSSVAVEQLHEAASHVDRALSLHAAALVRSGDADAKAREQRLVFDALVGVLGELGFVPNIDPTDRAADAPLVVHAQRGVNGRAFAISVPLTGVVEYEPSGFPARPAVRRDRSRESSCDEAEATLGQIHSGMETRGIRMGALTWDGQPARSDASGAARQAPSATRSRGASS